VLAYLNRGKSAPWLESHYTWAIRTFWIGLLGSFISFMLLMIFVVIGMFTMHSGGAIWFIVRIDRSGCRSSAGTSRLPIRKAGCSRPATDLWMPRRERDVALRTSSIHESS
jgi:uncharacterized membrane protein